MAKSKFSLEYLKECLDYNEITGVFTWKERPLHHFTAEWSWINWNKRWAGLVAGWEDKIKGNRSYWKISVNGENHKAHRLAWVFLNGEWPEKLIDHIDGNGLNNSAANLRAVNEWENATNQGLRKDNKSGLAGVGWQKQLGKWYANGRIKDHLQHLGFFEDKFEAICARKSWEAKNGFHPNHGKERKHER